MAMFPGGTDAQGNIYFAPPRMDMRTDTGDVMRADARGTSPKPVARVKTPDVDRQESGGENSRSVRVRPIPLAASDGWAVNANGGGRRPAHGGLSRRLDRHRRPSHGSAGARPARPHRRGREEGMGGPADALRRHPDAGRGRQWAAQRVVWPGSSAAGAKHRGLQVAGEQARVRRGEPAHGRVGSRVGPPPARRGGTGAVRRLRRTATLPAR